MSEHKSCKGCAGSDGDRPASPEPDRRIVVPVRRDGDSVSSIDRIESTAIDSLFASNDRAVATEGLRFRNGTLQPLQDSGGSLAEKGGRYGRRESDYVRKMPSDPCHPLKCRLEIFPTGSKASFTRNVDDYGEPERTMLREAILRRGEVGTVENERGNPPVSSMVHLDNTDLVQNGPVPRNQIFPRMGNIGSPIWEVRGGMLHCERRGITRPVFTFGAVLSYSCQCEPKAKLYWLIKKPARSGGYQFDPLADAEGSRSEALQRRWMDAITYTSDPMRDIYTWDEYGRPVPGTGPANSAVCMKSAVDNTTVPASFIVIGVVEWNQGTRCIQARFLKFEGQINTRTTTGIIDVSRLRAEIANEDVSNILQLPTSRR